MAEKQVKTIIKLQIKGSEANPAPPVGPALSQHGLNIMDFCKAFNQETASQKGIPFPVWITVFKDKTFEFQVKKPPASFLIKKSLGLDKGSALPHSTKIGTLTLQQLEDIAKEKMPDLNSSDLEACIKIIAGTARSMGVKTES